MEENGNTDDVRIEEQADEMTVEPTEEGTTWVDVTDLFEGEEEPPTKEQILEGARKENEKGDEREKQDFIKASSIAMSVGFFIAGIIMLVSVIVKDVFPMEVLAVTSGMQATQSLIVGLRNRRSKKLYLTVGIIDAICCVGSVVIWILQLCGVM